MDALSATDVPVCGRDATTTPSRDQWLPRLRELGLTEENSQLLAGSFSDADSSPPGIVQRMYRGSQIDQHTYIRVLGYLLSIPVLDVVPPNKVHRAFVDLIPIRFAREHRILGIESEDGIMSIVTDDLQDLAVLDHVGLVLGVPIQWALAPSKALWAALHEAYSAQKPDFDGTLEQALLENRQVVEVDYHEDGDLMDSASRAPVIKLVNMLLFEAVKRFASDVHIQPFPTHVQARFRIDGVLYDFLEIPQNLLDEVASRIKVIGRMDIAEKRQAQDGRTTVTVGERTIDLRISIIPTCYGERVVMRLLDKSVRLYALSEIGMSAADQTRFESLIGRTHGIILVTGPTGSGKSTTLYAALRHLDCRERNIITLEDPIEYQIPGISQVQVSTKKGMSFATGLRSVLRQDPDIIMVGEIRDEETARMAIQSSLTGHLVFSTLHTNNAAGAVSRLLDLGIEPYLVASSLLASLAQRLIRRVCPVCAVTDELRQDDLRLLQLDPDFLCAPVVRPGGCDQCGMTGYRGRQGVFELLSVNEEIQELITNRHNSGTIQNAAMKTGMQTLRSDAIRKLLASETTVDEVSRVTQSDGWNDETSSTDALSESASKAPVVASLSI